MPALRVFLMMTAMVLIGAGDRACGAETDDLYHAAPIVDVEGPVEGDVVVAGGQVRIDGDVAGDVIAAGGLTTLRGRVRDDVRVAGGRVTIGAVVGGDLVVAGGSVELTPMAQVKGRVRVIGGAVDVAGQIGGRLDVAGGSVRLDGQIAGDVRLAGGTARLGPRVDIAGTLTYLGPDAPEIHPDAKIAGGLRHQAPAIRDTAERAGRFAVTVFAVALNAGLALLGAALVLIWPGATRDVAARIGGHPVESLALGFASLVAMPVGMLLLVLTLVGLPLAIFLLATYLLALVVGYVMGAVFIGDIGLRLISRADRAARLWRVGALVAGMIALALLAQIPVLGWAVRWLALIAGLGAAAAFGWRQWQVATR